MKAPKLVVTLVVILCFVSFTYSLGTLFGLSQLISRVVKINPETADITPIGRFSYPKEINTQGISSIDVTHKIYYSIAYNTTAGAPYLIGLSLKNGVLIHSIRLPFSEGPFVGVGQYCAVIPSTGEVIVFGAVQTQTFHILKINPTTRASTLIASVSVAIDVLGGAAAYDPVHDLFLFQVGTRVGINNVGYSISHRRQVFNVSDSPHFLETMNFDSSSNTIIGVGFNNTERAVVSISPLTGFIRVIAPIPGYFLIDAQLAAFDTIHRILYAYLQPNVKHEPWRLVGIDVSTGKVVSSPDVKSHKPFGLAFDPTM